MIAVAFAVVPSLAKDARSARVIARLVIPTEVEGVHVGCPESFVTMRLRAERLREEHFGEMHRLHCNPDVMAGLGGVRTKDETDTYMARNLEHWAEHGFGVWVVRELDSDCVAGRAILRRLTLGDADEIELGFALHPEFWNRGLATEIAKACLRLARQELGLASVVAMTLPDNVRSHRVLKKIGFAQERSVTYQGVSMILFRSRAEEPGADGAG